MSSVRQGVLRAVRLLPEVVKIGVKPETALPSFQEEEQLSNGGASSGRASEKRETHGAGGFDSLAPEELRELNDRVVALEVRLSDAKLVEQSLLEKIASLETELMGTKNAFAQKERDLTASVEAAREKARAEGKVQGHAEGLISGHDAGLTKARVEVETQYKEKFSALVALLEGVSARLEERFADLVALNQPRMLRLWQEMLEKMLRRETNLAPDAVLDVLSDVLSRLSDKNHILIYVSPEDLGLLQAHLSQEFEEILRGVKHLELKPDTSVDRGSCIVETNLGVYDARWRTQLDQIETAVENLFQKLGKPPEVKEAARARAQKTESVIQEPETEDETTEEKTAAEPKKEKKPPKTTIKKRI